MLQVTITSVPKTSYQHELRARSHTIISDAPVALKGGDTGSTPHELFLMALGTCSAMTMEMYAERQGIPVQKLTVTVSETTIDDPTNPGTKIPHIVEAICIEGNLTAAQLAMLSTLPERCPIYKLVTGKKLIESAVTVVSPNQNPSP